MKKGKVFTKNQAVLALMVLCLGAAVWLNMKFSSEKYLGEAKYVSTTSQSVSDSDKTKKEDYFETAKKERETARQEATELIEETLKSDTLTDAEKQEYENKIDEIREQIKENEKKIAEYVRNQLKEDMMYAQISIKEYKDPFNGS